LAAAVTDETGSGSLVFATSPSLTTPSIAGLTLSGLVTHSGGYSQTGGANFNVEVTTAANLTATGSGTVTVGGAGGSTINGGTLTLSPSGFAYGAGAAAAHRTALGVQQLKAVVAISDESKTPNNTNYIDDAELFVTLEAGTWLVECNAFWLNADNTVGIRAQVAFDGTMDTSKSPIVVYSGSSNDSNNIATTSANSRPIGALTSTMPRAVIVAATGRNGIIQTEHTVSVSVAGTYRLQFGQGTASPTLAVIRKAGSFIRATKLA
jgi:hypothetical protein